MNYQESGVFFSTRVCALEFLPRYESSQNILICTNAFFTLFSQNFLVFMRARSKCTTLRYSKQYLFLKYFRRFPGIKLLHFCWRPLFLTNLHAKDHDFNKLIGPINKKFSCEFSEIFLEQLLIGTILKGS